MSQALSDLDRRLANLLRYGVIADLDEKNADGPRATVDLGDVVTDWLPWFTPRAGADRTWWAPEPGEQVMVLSPSGELSQGTILPAINSRVNTPNGDRRTLERKTYADGTVVQYDRAAHQLLVDASASNGTVVVNVGAGTVTVNCDQATVNAATSTTVNTKTAAVHATSSVTLDTPSTHCTGALTVDGNAVLKGTATVLGLTTCQAGLAVSGGAGGVAATVTGVMNVTGAVTGGSLKTAAGIDVDGHHHTAQGATSPTTKAQA